jgi:hypothetical protein
LKFYEILYRIVSNQNFKIYKENSLFYNNSFKLKFNENALDAKLLLNYFLNLKKIENHFDVKFTNINLDKTYENSVNKILAYINKTQLLEEFNEFTFENKNQEELEFLINNNEEDRVMFMSENEKTIIELYKTQFDLAILR